MNIDSEDNEIVSGDKALAEDGALVSEDESLAEDGALVSEDEAVVNNETVSNNTNGWGFGLRWV